MECPRGDWPPLLAQVLHDAESQSLDWLTAQVSSLLDLPQHRPLLLTAKRPHPSRRSPGSEVVEEGEKERTKKK